MTGTENNVQINFYLCLQRCIKNRKLKMSTILSRIRLHTEQKKSCHNSNSISIFQTNFIVCVPYKYIELRDLKVSCFFWSKWNYHRKTISDTIVRNYFYTIPQNRPIKDYTKRSDFCTFSSIYHFHITFLTNSNYMIMFICTCTC